VWRMWEGGKCRNGEIEFANYNLQMWVKILISKLLPCFVQQKKTAIINQLLRSEMAVGSNISEAQQAESRTDFIHKIKIAAKEASKTLYWLSIWKKSNIARFQQELMSELNQLMAIISKIIITAKKNT
jgi:four helix bundle protein